MIPVYVSYFAGGETKKTSKTLINSIGFVMGFSVIFVSLGVFAGTIGSFISQNTKVFNIISGLIIMFFALSFLGVFSIPALNRTNTKAKKELGFFSAIIFGMVFSISLTPCVGAFLGTALLQASQQATAFNGAIMLVFYSLGLGIPFILSAILINQLKSVFGFIKKHHKLVNIMSGIFLIAIALLMMTGYMNLFLSLLS